MKDKKYPRVKPEEHKRFLIGFLFGGNMELGLEDCVRRAYKDFARTLYGIGKAPTVKKALSRKIKARMLMIELLREMTERGHPVKLEEFDAWHRKSCYKIRDFYTRHEYESFTIGQAQKWINMSVKYVLSLASVRLLKVNHAESLRQAAHMPLDSFIQTALKQEAIKCNFESPCLHTAWSKIDDYKAYIQFNIWIRETYSGCLPLDVEFHLWNEENKRRRNKYYDDIDENLND